MIPFTQHLTASNRTGVLDAVEALEKRDRVTINDEPYVVESVSIDPPHPGQSARVTFDTPHGLRTLVLEVDVVEDDFRARVVEHNLNTHDEQVAYHVDEVVVGDESFSL